MQNKIGIDVGGTFTDAVLITGQKVEASGKVPTRGNNLLATILSALDTLNIPSKLNVEEITVSTTLVTNAILQNLLPKVELVLFPGSGMRLDSLNWPVKYHCLTGELDFRGREVRRVDKDEFACLLDELEKQEENAPVAIVGKFSHRNNLHEEQLSNYLKAKNPQLKIALGSQWGQTNFFRRSQTTYLNLASSELFSQFAAQLQEAIQDRGFNAPIRVLKADGGVLPLSEIRPVESVYSGPAASILGALAQSDSQESFVVVDIGGTTTDIGLVLSGEPLISSKGARIGSFLTNVRSLAVRSIPVGGDSAVLPDAEPELADYRVGPAYCLGGPKPTPTDAMRVLGLSKYGDYGKAEEGIAGLLPPEEITAEKIKKAATKIITKMVEKIAQEIENLLTEWKEEPAYKVWEVLNPHQDIKFSIHLSGGGAAAITAPLAQRMNTSVYLVESSEVSNAIGAAMAKPTFSWTLHLDTSLARYRIEETGEQGKWEGPNKPHRQVEDFLVKLASDEAKKMSIASDYLQKDTFDYFPLIDGFQTIGQIIRGAVHVPPGVTGRVNHES